MARAHFQVLVIAFRRLTSGSYQYLVLTRTDDGRRQWVAGGGEHGEEPAEAASREANEELGLGEHRGQLFSLDCKASIPTCHFQDSERWPENLLVIPEHCFALDCTGVEVKLSGEHTEGAWLDYAESRRLLSWDSNRTALWEFRERVRRNLLGDRLCSRAGEGAR